YTRSQFPNNQIPANRINPLLEAFLLKYVPQPNMTMPMGAADSNNYLDLRNETHFQDQGTIRIDHNFSNGDTVFARYSAGGENGFSPSSGVTSTTADLQGFGFGGSAASGAPWLAAQGYTGIGDTFAATPMHAWDTMIEGRNAYTWQHGGQGLKFGGEYHRYIWPMWGFFQNRGYYQFTNG